MRTDFFNEAIVTAMLAASSAGAGDTPPSGPDGGNLARADALQERLTALMNRADKAAVQAGMPNALVEAADFAACAFIDEALLSSTAWPGRLDWMKKPLQFERHETATAGEDFFRLLDSLLEDAERKAPVVSLPDVYGAAPGTVDTPDILEGGARDPLHAVLEIFALCLAQGFTGMFYDSPAAIQDRLDKIGRFVPAVGRRAEPFFLARPAKTEERKPLRRITDLFRRFDPLDWGLWLVPPVLTALLYYVCETRLDRMLEPLLSGGILS